MEKTTIKIIEELTKRDSKNIIERALKTSEEVGELAQAVLSYSNAGSSGYKNLTIEDILEEAVDSAMCALSVAFELGYSMEDVDKAMLNKLGKWAEIIEKDKQRSSCTTGICTEESRPTLTGELDKSDSGMYCG